MTGLDWLDVTTTVNISYNDMLGLLGSGQLTAFWHATFSEVSLFFADLGLLPPTQGFADPSAALILSAGSHTGLTSPPYQTWEYINLAQGTDQVLVYWDYIDYVGRSITDHLQHDPADPSSRYGHWLVPETHRPRLPSRLVSSYGV